MIVPERNLIAAILHTALEDARDGGSITHSLALQWLRSAWCRVYCRMLDIDPDKFADNVQRIAATKRARKDQHAKHIESPRAGRPILARRRRGRLEKQRSARSVRKTGR
jgi:hypothetical protein